MTMWTTDALKKAIATQQRSALFADLYGVGSSGDHNLDRIATLIKTSTFAPKFLYSAPGRTELAGNHTDHNHGKVLCAAVQNDTLAAVMPRSDDLIIIDSEGFPERYEISLDDLVQRESERETTQALIRGVVAGFRAAGGKVGGFQAHITSSVKVGSGLSSSASFEVLLGTILNDLYNDNRIEATEIARIAQFAENKYFGKPCGLMDQTASALGSILCIDFKDPVNIITSQIDYDLETSQYVLLVVDTGSSHADLTPAYASIPAEMGSVAAALGVEYLRDASEQELKANSQAFRSKLGDRPVLRALHFYSENSRVDKMVNALNADDLEAYLKLSAASGASSQNILQNAIPPQSDGTEQGLGFALGLSQLFFEERGRGMGRVHGGGFAGTIQSFVHHDDYEAYQTLMEKHFGPGSVLPLKIRKAGAQKILDLI